MIFPLASVIIPTANRPTLLPRAVDSALAGMDAKDVEVIVVPNGPDQSWRESLSGCQNNPSVRVLPIKTGHANVARNHGLANARGKYVRFLDDDDFLIPDAAKAQLIFAEETGTEFCSGLVDNMDADGSNLGILSIPETSDFVCISCMVSGFTVPVGNLILRSCLENASWNTCVPRCQDLVWMIDLAAAREWNWRKYDGIVGVWQQHRGQRVSNPIATEGARDVVEALIRLHAQLSNRGRIRATRLEAVAVALWIQVHRFFPYAPIYWTRIGLLAESFSPGSKPPHPFFSNSVTKIFPPLFLEWVIFPSRLLFRTLKKLRHIYFRQDYIRRI